MNVIQIIQLYKESLKEMYHEGELSQLTFMAFEHVKKFSKTDLVLKRDELVPQEEAIEFNRILKSLKSHQPIQYVLGYAWFYDLKLKVNSDVMIPRRETEELVKWIIDEIEDNEKKATIELQLLDVCTGSGCIAISLKKNLVHAKAMALDISENALALAKENALMNETEINFVRADVLQLQTLPFTPGTFFNIIVSNPPYILESEKMQMKKKELDFEPHLAFFVKDQDPLIFYKRIAELALLHLAKNGKLYFEINEMKGSGVVELLNQFGFSDVCLRKDFYGKDRMISASLKRTKN